MKKAFARLFGVDESEIDERDLPTVAIAGSGGGFRAMLNTTGSLIGAKRTGLLDCVTYIAGISGKQGSHTHVYADDHIIYRKLLGPGISLFWSIRFI